MKKNSKKILLSLIYYIFILGTTTLISCISYSSNANENKDLLKSSIALKLNDIDNNDDQDLHLLEEKQSKVFSGNILTKEVVTSLGWNIKSEITLSDWLLSAPNVTEISIDSTNGDFSDSAFNENKIIRSIVIPATVTKINRASFIGTSSLKSITFEPNSKLDKIGALAFQSSAINSISIPSSVITIGEMAFEQATSLSSLTFLSESKLNTIGRNAFTNTKITSINIPDSVTTIGVNAFSGAISLSEISLPYNEQLFTLEDPTKPMFGLAQNQWDLIVWKNIPNGGVKINIIIAKKILEKDAIITWDELTLYTGIQSSSFKNTTLKSIRIEWKNNFIIEDNAFIDAVSLVSIEISDKFEGQVQNYGFTNKQLESIIFIPSSRPPQKDLTVILSILGSLLGVAIITGAISYSLITKIIKDNKSDEDEYYEFDQ